MLETILLGAQPTELKALKQRVTSICELMQDKQFDTIHLVTGANHSQVKLAVADQPVTIVYNPYWQDGIGHSIAAGIQDVHYDTEAVLVVDVTDQHFDIAQIEMLVTAWQSASISMNLKAGLPAIFGAERFPELAALVDGYAQEKLSWGHQHDAPQAKYGF